LLAILGVVVMQGCMFDKGVSPVTLTAYRCAEPNQDKCLVPGDEIPVGTLPPMNEAFMVTAKYKGSAARFALIYPSKYSPGNMDSMVVQINQRDSASVWINLLGAKDGFYVERVTTTEAVADSVVWEFGWRRQQQMLVRMDGQPQAGVP
jgi:hypothetical protein